MAKLRQDPVFLQNSVAASLEKLIQDQSTSLVSMQPFCSCEDLNPKEVGLGKTEQEWEKKICLNIWGTGTRPPSPGGSPCPSPGVLNIEIWNVLLKWADKNWYPWKNLCTPPCPHKRNFCPSYAIDQVLLLSHTGGASSFSVQQILSKQMNLGRS